MQKFTEGLALNGSKEQQTAASRQVRNHVGIKRAAAITANNLSQ